jgi:hypothetical protein
MAMLLRTQEKGFIARKGGGGESVRQLDFLITRWLACMSQWDMVCGMPTALATTGCLKRVSSGKYVYCIKFS